MTIPTYPQFPSQLAQGFTLVEMLVVMAVMALAALLFVGRPQFGGSAAYVQSKVALRSELSEIRQAAITEGKIRMLDVRRRSIRLSPAVGTNVNQLLFWPDGSSNGGKLYDDQGRILAQVDWLSGDIYESE